MYGTGNVVVSFGSLWRQRAIDRVDSCIFEGTDVARSAAMRADTDATSRLTALFALALSAGCVIDSSDASLTVFNDSDYVIVELYLTEVDNPDYGPNLLGGDVLLPDEAFSIGVECGYYDALLVDEDGVDCELFDLDLCLNDADWVIRNNTCTVFGARGSERISATPVFAQSRL